MKQEWKAIKITSGKEERVKAALDELGICSFAPIITVKERRKGEWIETKRYLLPGYILIYINWTAELYHTLKEMWYVLYPLAGSVSQSEVDYLVQYEEFADCAAIDYSGEWVRYSGPIAVAPERILKVYKRKGRVLLKFQLGENETKRWLPVKIKK